MRANRVAIDQSRYERDLSRSSYNTTAYRRAALNISDYRHLQQKRRKRPTLITLFAYTASFACVATMAVLLAVGISEGPSVLSDEPLSYKISLFAPKGHSSYLATVNRDYDRRLEDKALKLADIIRGHKKNIKNAFPIAKTIVRESLNQGIDPIFVTSVINAESTFNPRAKSPVGARGLMQVMPATAKYIDRQEGFSFSGKKDLYSPEYNIRLGVWYLKYLEEMFDGDVRKMLIAYNWGPGNLNKALRAGRKPPRSTEQYAKKIMKYHRKWAGKPLSQVEQKRDPFKFLFSL